MVSPRVTYINHRNQMLRARFTEYKGGHGTQETERYSEDKDLENVLMNIPSNIVQRDDGALKARTRISHLF